MTRNGIPPAKARPGPPPSLPPFLPAAAPLRLTFPAPPGAQLIHTYCEADEDGMGAESRKAVTTSPSEASNHLVRAARSEARSSRRSAGYYTMRIVFDCADAVAPPDDEEQLLCTIKVFSNGRFEMRPGLSRPGDAYRFERPNGAIYSFRLENASEQPAASEEARKAKLKQSSAQWLARTRRAAVGGDFAPPPGPAREAIRVTLLGEIVAAKGFTFDDLYIEWSLTCVCVGDPPLSPPVPARACLGGARCAARLGAERVCPPPPARAPGTTRATGRSTAPRTG